MSQTEGNLANLDLDQEEGKFGMDPLPANWYPAVIASTETCESQKDEQNNYERLDFEISGDENDEHNGRLVRHNYNLWNKNEKAVQIARREMKGTMVAAGVPQAKDTFELVGKTVAILIGLRKDDSDRVFNEVRNVKPIQELADLRKAFASGNQNAAARPSGGGTRRGRPVAPTTPAAPTTPSAPRPGGGAKRPNPFTAPAQQ